MAMDFRRPYMIRIFCNCQRRRPSVINAAGFTLIETLIVIAIVTILAGLGMTTYSTWRQRSMVSAATMTTAQALHQAVMNSQTARQDSGWGAVIEATGVTIYAGPSYVSRIAGSEIRSPFPATVTITGDTAYSFAKRTGRPLSPGSTTITVRSDTNTVSVNALGTITN